MIFAHVITMSRIMFLHLAHDFALDINILQDWETTRILTYKNWYEAYYQIHWKTSYFLVKDEVHTKLHMWTPGDRTRNLI